MKKRMITIFFLLAIILLTGISLYVYFIDNKKIKYISPDGSYMLIVKKEMRMFTPKMPGDGGSGNRPVRVILKDRKGKVIGKSDSNPDCGIFESSLEIEWDLENDLVWYGKGKSIHVKTGKVGC